MQQASGFPLNKDEFKVRQQTADGDVYPEVRAVTLHAELDFLDVIIKDGARESKDYYTVSIEKDVVFGGRTLLKAGDESVANIKNRTLHIRIRAEQDDDKASL